MQASTIQKTMKEPLVSEHLDFPKLYNKKDMVNVVFFFIYICYQSERNFACIEYTNQM